MVNTQVIKTPQGFLKILHVILSAVAFGIATHYFEGIAGPLSMIDIGLSGSEVYYFQLVTFAFMICSFLLLLSTILDESSDNLGRSYFELLYHLVGCLLFFTATISFIAFLAKFNKQIYFREITTKVALAFNSIACICGLVNAAVYGGNALLAFKLRRS